MKPMLAATVDDVKELRFPVLASPKLDGVRALVIGGVVFSRSLKPIPNLHVQNKFRSFEGYDGELIVGSPTADDCYRKTMSGVMSQHGEPDVALKAFDYLLVNKDTPFYKRLGYIIDVLRWHHQPIGDMEELQNYEDTIVEQGYEGLILRDPKGPYKFGRSTMNEGFMMKLKRFRDDEAEVIGFKELMHNDNPLEQNELGYAKRSSHKENKIPTGKLGALTVKWSNGIEFDIGTGFDDALRNWIWDNKEKYLGQVVKFKYLHVGMKDRPRHPVFLGWRSTLDIGV